ncbi:MAG: helicase [Deltaproteobacteria bacterium]|nr:MAG: helicase [Deltaproteobacteria bacterium]
MKAGTVIRLRERLWRVDRVSEVDFAATPIDGRDSRRRRFLRSLEEAGVSEGSLPPPDPDRLGDAARQDLLLRAHRLSLIHGSAPFLGLQRSRAVPEAYQLVPLLMALDASPVRLLIGDDVGIGKTIEAGLIVSELLARGSAERLLVVVPASLREQWRESLSRFFHLDAIILSGQTRPALERRLLPGESPWEAFPVVIASIDYLKRRTGEVLSHAWDIVVVDEAHIAARPHEGPWRSTLQKQRWEFLDALSRSDRVRHLLLLSATPHPGHTDSFASLLAALNPECVGEDGTIRRHVARRHVVQRRRRDLREWYGHRTPFPQRSSRDEIIPMGPAEERLLHALRAYCRRLVKARAGTPIAGFVALHLQRRALSSPKAILQSLTERIRKLRRLARSAAEEAAAVAEAEAAVTDHDSPADLEDEDRWARIDRAALLGTEEEIAELEKLRRRARALDPAQDGKLAWLLAHLPGLLSRHPRAPRVLVFTRYKHTLEYLAAQLGRERGRKGAPLAGVEVFTIHGEMTLQQRREVFHAFERAGRAVCIATDCISEGLDLQRGCAELVHYELPWNPNRLEQRNGRIDRYGQPEPTVGITTLVREDELDVTILEVLIRKAGAIREAYGFCPVVFSSIEDLERLIAKYRPDPQLLLPFDDFAPAGDPFDEARIRRIEEESFYGQEEVRLPEVEQALQETYRTVGSPEEIRGFVLSALAWAGAHVEELPGGTLGIDLRGTALADLAERLEATFDPRIARDEPDLDLLDIAHPLVRRLIDTVREAAAGTQEGRVAVRGSREVPEVTAILHVLPRYVTASDPPVVMEELIPVLFRPYGGSVLDVDAYVLMRAPAAPLPHTESELRDLCRDALATESLPSRVDAAVEARRAELQARQASVRRLASAWAEGMDRVEVASVDWLTLTLLVPANE